MWRSNEMGEDGLGSGSRRENWEMFEDKCNGKGGANTKGSLTETTKTCPADFNLLLLM